RAGQAGWRLHLLLRDLPLRGRVHPRARQSAGRVRPGNRSPHGPMAYAADDPWWPLPHAHGEEAAPPRRAGRRARQRRMTPLGRALEERIRREGPITVEAYMEACNDYYYATRDPFGSSGDFTTAPEIHQMFGEIVGAALGDIWVRAGKPANAVYAELGPGRGTLAADALRVMR